MKGERVMKTMEKIRSLTAVILMTVLLILPVQMPAFASGEPYTVEQDGFVYQVWTDGTNELHSVFVVEYKGSAAEVELPKPQSLVIDGKTYPAIEYTAYIVGDGAKSVFPSNQVTKVAVPSGYEAISGSAFLGCSSLTEIAIAGTVNYVGENAFAGCANLTTYYLETNASLTSGGSGDPRIAQTADGSINAKQVTVYTKSTNDSVTSYVADINSTRKAGDPEVVIKYVDDPYSMSSVKPGSGSTGGSGGSQQKGNDGTALGEGAAESVADSFLINYSAETDPAGTVFSVLQMKAAKATKNSIKLTWKKASGAVRFIVYGNKCGKGNKYVKQAETKSASITLKKINKSNIKKGTYYKFIVVALDSKGNVVSTSKTVHVATAGGKVGNAKTVTTKAKKNKVSIKVKKTFNLKAKAKPASSKLKVKKHRGLLYESTDKKVATVDKKGVIKGVGKGTCYVYVYAQNGICKKIKVTVKK